jgi:hypothetical protein
MPQVVDVVGYGKVEFPDGMSRDAMAEALKSLPPKSAPQATQQPAPQQEQVQIPPPRVAQQSQQAQQVPAPKPTVNVADNPFADPNAVFDPVSGAPMGSVPIAPKIGATLAATAGGTLQPVAGALQYAGINKPAQLLKEASDAFKQIGGTSAKVGEFVGEVGSPLTSKAAQLGGQLMSKVPGLAKSVLARSAGQGAGASVLMPTETTGDYGDFLTEKAKQVGLGAGVGAVIGKGTQMLMSPQVSDKMQMLKDMGMKYFTPGQLAADIPVVGKGLQTAEKAMTSLPITGSLIRGGLKTSEEDFNRAIANKVLGSMGEKVPKEIPAGERMVEYVNQRISDAYDALTPYLKIQNITYKDPTSSTGITSTAKALNDTLKKVTYDLPSSTELNLQQAVRDEFEKLIINPLLKQGGMSGEEFRLAEKALGKMANTYMRDPIKYDVGVALKELQAELRNELVNQNPALASVLQGIHRAFRQHLPFERAAGYVGAENRVFSPGQFESAVRAQSQGKGQFASGQSLMYPESQAGLSVLGRSMPSSGTAERALTNKAVGLATEGAGALFAPQVMVPLAMSGMLYNKPAMSVLSKLATERPQVMKQAAPLATTLGATAGGVKASQP